MENFHEKVELIPAFVWDCPECGQENFERAIVPEFSPEQMQEMRLERGIDPLEDGDFLVSPTNVECKHCGTSYGCHYFGAELADEADEIE